jgi:hypothetical protein
MNIWSIDLLFKSPLVGKEVKEKQIHSIKIYTIVKLIYRTIT